MQPSICWKCSVSRRAVIWVFMLHDALLYIQKLMFDQCISTCLETCIFVCVWVRQACLHVSLHEVRCWETGNWILLVSVQFHNALLLVWWIWSHYDFVLISTWDPQSERLISPTTIWISCDRFFKMQQWGEQCCDKTMPFSPRLPCQKLKICPNLFIVRFIWCWFLRLLLQWDALVKCFPHRLVQCFRYVNWFFKNVMFSIRPQIQIHPLLSRSMACISQTC